MGAVVIVLINGGGHLDRFGSSPYLGRLVSPRSGNSIKPGERWAADNDAYGAWDEGRFLKMLNRFQGTPGCLFVTAPDVVADAQATLDLFDIWQPRIAAMGFPVAFVAQDGAENLDLPWDRFTALFIGGSTDWKLSASAADLAAKAKQLGKWIHVGRVNTQRRLRAAFALQADSTDGTGWSKFPDVYMNRHLPVVRDLNQQGNFFHLLTPP